MDYWLKKVWSMGTRARGIVSFKEVWRALGWKKVSIDIRPCAAPKSPGPALRFSGLTGAGTASWETKELNHVAIALDSASLAPIGLNGMLDIRNAGERRPGHGDSILYDTVVVGTIVSGWWSQGGDASYVHVVVKLVDGVECRLLRAFAGVDAYGQPLVKDE